jgi:glycosyltransferase involved in cell wall biosynthesis
MNTVFMMAKNASGVIERTLSSALPHFGEFVLVANDCTDNTVEVARKFCEAHKIAFVVVEVRRESHPELYQLDVAETYQVGKSLLDEEMPGPFTGELMLADWATARNLGWKLCTGDKILFLDADDVVVEAEQIKWAADMMDAEGWDVMVSRYEILRGKKGEPSYAVFRERLARRGSTEWVRKIHEGLDLKDRKIAMMSDGLYVRDCKDSRGAGTRIPNRNFKILYLHCRQVGWENAGPHYLSYMIMEAKEVWPAFTLAAAKLYLPCSTWNEQRAWVLSMAGEAHEALSQYPEALEIYEMALKENNLASAAFKAARCSFFAKDWKKVIEFYVRGLKASMKPSLFDHNLTLARATKLLYCSALAESGRIEQASNVVGELRREFPESKPVEMLWKVIEAKVKEKTGATP